jgi:23S rRNA (pseudouridine1915-N3)-methyltransferase
MKIALINPGVTQDAYIREGLSVFEKRIKHYIGFEIMNLSIPRALKSQSQAIQKESEGRLILSAIEKVDHPVLLDVTGKQMDSPGFARFLQQSMNRGTRNLAFIIGGPYGFSDEVYQRIPDRISFSSMTFSHQLIRLIFMEQLYRAFTIIKGEPYHHE